MRLRRSLARLAKEEGGFSLTELVVAGFLTTILAGMMLGTFAQIQQSSQVLSERSYARIEGRESLDASLRWLRNSRPPGACINPPDATTTATCYRVGESSAIPAVFYADSSRICFFAYTTESSGRADSLVAPQKACLGRNPEQGDLLTLQIWEPPTQDYVGAWTEKNTEVGVPPSDDPTEVRSLGLAGADPRVFSYFTVSNQAVCSPGYSGTVTSPRDCVTGSLAPQALESLGRVDMVVETTNPGAGEVEEQRFATSVALRGARYGDADRWDGGLR